jgi:hypothetical protein
VCFPQCNHRNTYLRPHGSYARQIRKKGDARLHHAVERTGLSVGKLYVDGTQCLGFESRSNTGHMGFFTGVQLASGVVRILGMVGAYNLIFIYTCELLPTVVWNAALGLIQFYLISFQCLLCSPLRELIPFHNLVFLLGAL